MTDQAQTLTVAPTDEELERAIASVPGVVSAGIERQANTGRSRMRLRLAPGEDEEAVSWAVAATLRERFGIALDPDAIRPRPAVLPDPDDDPVQVVHEDAEEPTAAPDATAVAAGDAPMDPTAAAPPGAPPAVTAPAEVMELSETRERLQRAVAAALDDPPPPGSERVTGDGGLAHTAPARVAAAHDGSVRDRVAPAARPEPSAMPRAAIEHLQILREADSVEVSVTLDHDGRSATGHVRSVPTSSGTLRAVAEATVAALRALTEGSLLVGIDRVSIKDDEDESTATVVVTLLTRRGEERLLGASLVRNDAERAVMRATLDALNRRVTPLLERGSAADVRDGSPGVDA